ncbi:hypothetical protein AGRHK599_LOCUS1282 [Rhizobium rhizogenes]|uniref:Uncharacterized protein n=1 Tax=Rhizobium rhizogenes TaxID=359 RepID=A0AAN2A3R7_RHIRH|nr:MULTISPECIES: hypothetical protein [Rhizobium/Agrobacterium group]MCZ7443053.1 hypothetical protein [Rhizobium rhizogenes]NSZ79039.1 hypothetical protein [Agrobacterium tumefaciens]CAD0211255.1 hypothetical protein AGRHK599_LOCUS1282 [Rhizobium rhizogenes]
MADNNKKPTSVMFGGAPTAPKKKRLSEADRQLIINAGENPDDYEYEDGYDPENPSAFVPPNQAPTTLSDADRQLIIDAGENPDDYEYVPGYDPNKPSAPNAPWTRQDGDTVYYDDNTPVSVKAINQEVPASVRAEVAALTKPEDRLRALRKYYPDAQAVGTEQFIMRDPETNKPMVYNIEGWTPSWGDVADALPEVAGTIGATIGGIGGAALGGGSGSVVPIVGTTTGALAGGAAGGSAGYTTGKQLYERGMNWLYDNEDTRTTGEQALDIGKDALIGATAELGGAVAAPIIGRGFRAAGNALRPSRIFGGLSPADDVASAATRLSDFEQIGVTPTPGMIGGANAATREQSRLTGNQAMSNRVGEVYDQVGQRFDDVIERTTGGRNLSAAEAGDAIQQRARDFKDITKQRQAELYDRAGELTDGVPASVTNTSNFLKSTRDELKGLGQSAKMNSGDAYESSIKQAEAIVNDVNAGASFDTLKQARTAIGDIAFGRDLGTKESQLFRSLYKSLTDDMTETAAKAGDDAIQAMRKANNFTARMKNPGNLVSQNVPDEILRKQVPEAAYKLVMSGSKNAGSKITQMVRQAKIAGGDDAVRDIGSSVFNKLGRDKAGDFSPSRLIADWDAIPKETKTALYMTKDGNELRKAMEDIVKVSRQLVEYGGTKNHSNTARHLSSQLNDFVNTASIAGAISTASPSALLIPVIKYGADRASKKYAYKLFSSPETLKWMAGLNQGTQRGAINRISTIYRKTTDANLKIAIRDYLNDLQESQ